ncbi:hypothetical protein [Empedobacter stercoris]|uniref:DUF4868 domain-containing protein n=1 Tax=Empedobacter stercoris TaxID=1628248 RepID=A0ABX1WNL2_9FLAO|nr:hypothetical protein [Empedobacter stercoris]MCA4776749.1 hypothetical protein [Empedobacter stercoris]NOJ76200.1 hypothetical protein [Empedobacter stercoris]
MKLEFSKKKISEILNEFQDKNTFQWQDDIFELMEKIDGKNEMFNFHYMKEDNIYTSTFNRQFVNETFQSLNRFLGLKSGDSSLLISSVLENEGEISLVQAIEGGLDLYCHEDLDQVKIPLTNEGQSEIGYALNYAYLTKNQLENSFDDLARIEKIAIESDYLSHDLIQKLKDHKKTSFYQVFTANGFPIAVKNIDDIEYTVLDKIELSEDEKGHLVLSSPYEDESLNLYRQAVISDDQKKFRWISGNECKLNGKDVVNLEVIEEKLKPYIDYNFSVVTFPKQGSTEDVISLVIESRFTEHVDIQKSELERNEVPQQTFFIGEFPKSKDKAAIRKELIKLLNESDDNQ